MIRQPMYYRLCRDYIKCMELFNCMAVYLQKCLRRSRKIWIFNFSYSPEAGVDVGCLSVFLLCVWWKQERLDQQLWVVYILIIQADKHVHTPTHKDHKTTTKPLQPLPPGFQPDWNCSWGLKNKVIDLSLLHCCVFNAEWNQCRNTVC